MKKEDLESGMILDLENNKRGLILDNEIFLIKKGENFSGSLSLSFIDNNFILQNYNIFAVYKPLTPKDTNIGTDLQSFMFDDYIMKTIWTRQNTEELTLEQVCKELGREIKIIKG